MFQFPFTQISLTVPLPTCVVSPTYYNMGNPYLGRLVQNPSSGPIPLIATSSLASAPQVELTQSATSKPFQSLHLLLITSQNGLLPTNWIFTPAPSTDSRSPERRRYSSTFHSQRAERIRCGRPRWSDFAACETYPASC